MDAQTPGLADTLALQLRQSLQTCCSHASGPLVTYSRCLKQYEDGALSGDEFRRIGSVIIERSRERIDAAVRDAREGDSSIRRERQIIAFVGALFAAPSAPSTWHDGSRLVVGVVGKGRNCPPDVYELAYEAGRTIGRHHDDVVVVTGGLGGVMEAASRGARESGAFVVGILPAAGPDTPPRNAYLDLAVDTGLSFQVRNVVVASTVDVMVALPGSHGALQETIVALDLEKRVWAVGEHQVLLPGVVQLSSTDELDSVLAETVGGAEAIGARVP